MWTIIGIMVFIILLVTFWQLWVALFVAILGIILFPIAFLMSILNNKEKDKNLTKTANDTLEVELDEIEASLPKAEIAEIEPNSLTTSRQEISSSDKQNEDRKYDLWGFIIVVIILLILLSLSIIFS